MTFEEKAEQIIGTLLDENDVAMRTGLRKTCPSCKRTGVVYFVGRKDRVDTVSFAIVWRPREQNGEEVGDIDLRMPLVALLDNKIGCGAHRTKSDQEPDDKTNYH